ncbi:hypothetical protein [Phenylobacterium sp.]|uniref:hypothetical protein n=1 Tax=Phenylobacterium sp. TaxID=1871053 RepID=UPI00286B3C26|nr:hypothetical protein [Phenylobacterium sp.]
MDGLDMDDLAAGVQIIVDDAIRKAAPGIARAAIDETESTAALLRASFELAKSEVVALVAEGGRHEPWAKQAHAFGDQVGHRGGTWRVVARREAKPTDEPGPDSSVWLATQIGIEAVGITSINSRLARVHVSLTDGTTKGCDIRIPGLRRGAPTIRMRPTRNWTRSLETADRSSPRGTHPVPVPATAGWRSRCAASRVLSAPPNSRS